MENYCYKIVSVEEDGKLYSINHSIDYTEKNVWIYPKENNNQYLFVFDTLQNALHFRKNYLCSCHYKILKVETLNITEEVTHHMSGIKIHSSEFPIGTLFCKAVKVIEEV